MILGRVGERVGYAAAGPSFHWHHGMITTSLEPMTTLFDGVNSVKTEQSRLQAIMSDSLRQVDRTYVMWKNRRLSYFAGCDYFRLSSHPEVLRAVHQGLQTHG